MAELEDEFKTQLSQLLNDLRNNFLNSVRPNDLNGNQALQKRQLLNLFRCKIDKHITRIENNENIDLLEIHHLFYDEIYKRKSI